MVAALTIDRRRRRAGLTAGALLIIVFQVETGFAQGAPVPPIAPLAPRDEPAVPQGSQPPRSEPSFVDKLGDLIKDSVDGMSSTLKGTQRSIEDLNKGTMDNLSRLPVTGFAVGRAVCTRADNGAPDCRSASDRLCQEKGYKTGQSLEIQTAENCNPRVFIPGHQRRPDDCRTDNYVTRASCN